MGLAARAAHRDLRNAITGRAVDSIMNRLCFPMCEATVWDFYRNRRTRYHTFSGCVAGDNVTESRSAENRRVGSNGKDRRGRRAGTDSSVSCCPTTVFLGLVSVSQF